MFRVSIEVTISQDTEVLVLPGKRGILSCQHSATLRRVCHRPGGGTVSTFFKHKVPPPYSRAGTYARSLNGRRDDEFFVNKFKLHRCPAGISIAARGRKAV